jgi:hypothetical protein
MRNNSGTGQPALTRWQGRSAGPHPLAGEVVDVVELVVLVGVVVLVVVVTSAVPITMATLDPGASLVPLAGFWLVTTPTMVGSEVGAVVTVALRPAAESCWVAAAWDRPTTLGTWAPVET